MSEPQLDLFGEPIAPPAAAPASTPTSGGKTKLVFGQTPPPAPAPAAPARNLPPSPSGKPATRGTMPPPLALPQYVRPEHERKIDEAQAGSLIFGSLQRLAERRLFELRQEHANNEPRLPTADEVRLAAELLLADPAVALRLSLVAGSFWVAAAAVEAPVLAPTAAPAVEAQDKADEASESSLESPAGNSGDGDEEASEAEEGADEAREASEEAPVRERPTRRQVSRPPTDGKLAERVARLIVAINGQQWGVAEPLVRHFPDNVRPHWEAVLRQARTAWDVISHVSPETLDQAEELSRDIDSEPVRAALMERIGVLGQSLAGRRPEPPAPEPELPARPQRRTAGRQTGCGEGM